MYLLETLRLGIAQLTCLIDFIALFVLSISNFQHVFCNFRNGKLEKDDLEIQAWKEYFFRLLPPEAQGMKMKMLKVVRNEDA